MGTPKPWVWGSTTYELFGVVGYLLPKCSWKTVYTRIAAYSGYTMYASSRIAVYTAIARYSTVGFCGVCHR